MPIVKLVEFDKIISPSGSVIMVYGHRFVVQPNGEAHADIDPAFVKMEVAAGRVLEVAPVTDSGPISNPYIDNGPIVNEKEPEEKILQGDASNFFGYESARALNERIRTLKRPELVSICNELGIGIPSEMGKSTMVLKICSAVDQMAKKMQEG